MAANRDNRIPSPTLQTTLVDFEEVGDIGVFIDENQVSDMEKKMDERGFLDGSEMAAAFTALRANDLVWSFVINNYLLGRDPVPFDILYWNSDSTRMPATMQSFYMRRMYLDNALVEPGAIELGGTPLDLTRIRTPSYILSTREDHIAPWQSTYKATGLYKGEKVFTLAMSGHVAGVVNAPARNKYGYWVNDALPESAGEWFAGAGKRDGSWWPHWAAWLAGKAGAMVPAREPGDGALPALDDAPGAYVRVDLRARNATAPPAPQGRTAA